MRAIFDDVAARGWPAVAEHAERLDGAAPALVPVEGAARRALAGLSAEEAAAFDQAVANITAFHTHGAPADVAVEIRAGLTVRKVWRPIGRVGLYIPGGATPLFSTLLMLALPARAAGVEELVVATPPRSGGGLDALVECPGRRPALRASKAVWTLGGVQAVAALALGAGDIQAVDKICGPGSAWVSEAKRLAASLPGGPAIDLPAGPSELMVVADARADPALVAADLMSQAEHDAAAQVLLVTTSAVLARAVAEETATRLRRLPRRRIAAKCLATARAILVRDLDEALAVADLYAPEHLSLAVEDADRRAERVRNAGAIFAGAGAAETFGDYLAGSSHVLPTDGAARAWSGVGVHTFVKAISIQSVTRETARHLAAPAAALPRLEGLEAHAQAAEARARPGQFR